MISALLNAASKYSNQHKIAMSTLGQRCARDARFFSRLKVGHTLTLKKYQQVMDFLRDNPPEQLRGRRKRKAANSGKSE